jgi:hypothetical protein
MKHNITPNISYKWPISQLPHKYKKKNIFFPKRIRDPIVLGFVFDPGWY